MAFLWRPAASGAGRGAVQCRSTLLNAGLEASTSVPAGTATRHHSQRQLAPCRPAAAPSRRGRCTSAASTSPAGTSSASLVGPDWRSSRAIVVGQPGAVAQLQQQGTQDVLLVMETDPGSASQPLPSSSTSTVGNDLGVRTWQGSFLQLPDYMGPADVVLLGWQAVSATAGADAAAARALLTKACLATRHGGHVVLARSSGGSSGGAGGLSREEVAQLTAGLPLALQQLAPEQQPWLAAVLQVPEHYRLAGGPVYLGGPVVTGFGRGSKKLGVPTANIDPAALDAHVASAPGGDRQAVPLPPGSALQRLPPGVYFGYAQLLDAPPGAPAADGQLHRMVMNIGRRPTVNTGDEAPTVEAHILHRYAQDFYGCRLQVALLGFIRPEMKFSGLGELLSRIKADTALAQLQLSNCADMAPDRLPRDLFKV